MKLFLCSLLLFAALSVTVQGFPTKDREARETEPVKLPTADSEKKAPTKREADPPKTESADS